MLNEENKKLCWQVLSKYGVENQQRMVIEECAELQKAICKLFRDKDKKQGKYQLNYIEEIVDVIVMCQQMLLNSGMDMDEVNKRAKVKLERALQNDKKSY